MKTPFLAAVLALAAVFPSAAQTVDSVLTNGLADPYGVAVEGTAYYVADSANHRIVSYKPGTGVLSSLAGFIGHSGTNDGKSVYARFNIPMGLVSAPALGGLVVADYGNQTLRLVKLDGSVSTLAGTPGVVGMDSNPTPALAAHFNFPLALAVDTNGNVFIADSKNSAIRKYDPLTHIVSTVVAGLHQPSGLAVGDNGDLWIADSRDHTVIQLPGGTPPASLVAGTPGQSGALDSLFATQIPDFDIPGALFNNPGALLWLGATNGLLVCDSGNHALRRIYQDPAIIGYSVDTYAGVLAQPGFVNGPLLKAQFSSPTAVVVDSIGGFLVVDAGNNALRQIQTAPPQPPVRDPVIGWVAYQKDQFGEELSYLVPVTHAVFNNDVTIAIRAEPGTRTSFTYGATPLNSLQDTIPSPDEASTNRYTPPFYQDGMHAPEVPPSIVQPQPDLTIKAIGTANNRKPSAIVQARFEFETANPTILGDNAACFVLTNITSGAQMWYTTDGSDPVMNGEHSTQIGNGQVSLPRSSAPIIFKIRAYRTDLNSQPTYRDSEIVTKVFDPADFQANRISFGFDGGEGSSDFVASAGQTFFAPVTLSLLPNQKMYTLQFNVTVTNLEVSPPVNGRTVGFSSMLQWKIEKDTYLQIPPALFVGAQSVPPELQPYPGFGDLLATNPAVNLLGVGWLERAGQTNLYDSTKQDLITYSIAHDTVFLSKNQKVIVGGYTFQVPTDAVAGQTYQIQIGRPSATSDGVNQDNFIEPITDGTLTSIPTNRMNSIKNVTVGQRRYIVGDVAPFRWFNAGDFGEGLLLNNDVVQVFQSAIYLLNRPPEMSDFFAAMDSSNGLTNAPALDHVFFGDDSIIDEIQFGDGALNVDDVYVTFRRSLDPTRTWYARYWENGRLQATAVENVGRAAPSRPGQVIGSAAPDLPAASFLPGEPSAAFSVDDQVVTAGQTLRIPIRATVTGMLPLRVLMLNLTIEPLDGSPPLLDPVEFTSTAALSQPTLTDSRGIANYAGAWLNNQVAGIAGVSVLGYLKVTIPPMATAASAYRVHFDHASGSPNGVGLFPKQIQDGLLTLRNRSDSTLGDGIPDSWRLRYFGSASTAAAQGNLDADGDGLSNLAEFRAGTNPVQAESNLRLMVRRLLNSQPGQLGVSLHWQTVLNKNYVLEASPSPVGGKWNVISSGLAGTGQDIEFTPTAANASQFYRVRVSE